MTSEFKFDINEKELIDWFNDYKYKGFDRAETIRLIKQRGIPVKVIAQISFAVALRGPKRCLGLKFGDKTLDQWGIPATVPAGSSGLSAARINFVFPHVARDMLARLKVEKRIQCDCPAELQFPGAAGIRMNKTLRAQHREFSEKYSELIGGKFNAQIYDAATTREFDE
jgi:hypothetical protein